MSLSQSSRQSLQPSSASQSNRALVIGVAFYRPKVNSNYAHWALDVYDRSTGRHTLFQVVGDQHDLQAEEIQRNPRDSSKYIRTIQIGQIQPNEYQPMVRIIRDVDVQNEVFHWDCQDYVLELIEALEDNDFLGDMPNYRLITDKIKDFRGPWESTARSIQSFNPSSLRAEESGDDLQESSQASSSEDGSENREPKRILSADRVEDSSDE